MSIIEKIFIADLKNNCDKNISFIDEIASVLDINYDAAYRRANNKTNISLNEAVKLAARFNVSLDNYLEKNTHKKMIVSTSNRIQSLEDLENYFLQTSKKLVHLQNRSDASIIYCAKDLPLFYFVNNPLFSQFKMYTVLYFGNRDFPLKKIPFEHFKIPNTLIHASDTFGKLYDNVNITEVWTEKILEGTIFQISYFFELNLLTYNTAMILINSLKEIMEKIEINASKGVKGKNKTKYELYQSELISTNNNIVINTNHKNYLISAYSDLNYFFIEDQPFIKNFKETLNQQLQYATLLSKSSIKECLLFFKPKYKAIERLKQKIDLMREFPIR